jgi:serine/threonine protein kinase
MPISGGGKLSLAQFVSSDLEASTPPPAVTRFRIIREIGRGGMGMVYHAEEKDPARSVAQKFIHPDRLSTDMLHRFRRETARLNKPMS